MTDEGLEGSWESLNRAEKAPGGAVRACEEAGYLREPRGAARELSELNMYRNLEGLGGN